MKRILVPTLESHEQSISRAFVVALRECQSRGIGQFTLITAAKDKLDTNLVGEFLGTNVSRRLMRGDRVPVSGQNIHVSHESVATIQKVRTPPIGLAVHLSQESIQKLDGLLFDCLIFVPWLDSDGQAWAQKWNAETFGGLTEGAEIDLPITVVEALKSLTASVNLSTGLAHPSDLAHAKASFAALRAARIIWNPTELEKWAVRNGWSPAGVAVLAKLSAHYV